MFDSTLYYLFVNFLIIAGPLGLSFIGEDKFINKIRPVIISVSITSFIFIFWDIIATLAGHWSFNSKFITGLYIGPLPIEEILFFFTANYATLFLYEVFVTYFKPTEKEPYKSKLIATIFLSISSLFLILLGVGEYTIIVIILSWIMLMIEVLKPFLTKISKFYVYIIFVLIVFIFINTILTYIPIVEYNESAITGLRIGTIPIEDFFFNYLMVFTSLIIYLKAQRRNC